MAAMTKAAFIAYWMTEDALGMTPLEFARENVGEREAQYRSECAMFGDAGPGQALTLSDCKRDLAKVEKRLKEFGAI